MVRPIGSPPGLSAVFRGFQVENGNKRIEIRAEKISNSFGRFSGALAGRIGKPIMRKTERHEPFFLLYGKK